MYTPMNMDRETGIKKKVDFTIDILNNDLFPHCNNLTQKIYFLGYMTNKVLQAKYDIIKLDDRDSYVNKRVDLSGSLLNNLFRNYFNKLVKDMSKQILREINNGSWRSTDNYLNIINRTNIYKIVVSPLLTVLTPLISLLLPLIFLFYMQRKTGVNIPMTTVLTQYIKTLFGSDSMKLIFKDNSKAMIASLVTKGIYDSGLQKSC